MCQICDGNLNMRKKGKNIKEFGNNTVQESHMVRECARLWNSGFSEKKE